MMPDPIAIMALAILALLAMAALAACAVRTADAAIGVVLAILAVAALAPLAMATPTAGAQIAVLAGAPLGVVAVALIAARSLTAAATAEETGMGSGGGLLVLVASAPLLLLVAQAPAAQARPFTPTEAPIWPIVAPLALAGLAVAALLGFGERAAMDQPAQRAAVRAESPLLARAAKAAVPPLILIAVHMHLAVALSPAGAVAAGAVLAAAAALYALVFGLAAALRGAPPGMLRALAASGLLLVFAGETAADHGFASEAIGRAVGCVGASLAVFAGLTLALFAILGRARRIEEAGP